MSRLHRQAGLSLAQLLTPQAVGGASVALWHAVRVRGWRPAGFFAGLSLGSAFLAEIVVVQGMPQLHHHVRPQIGGVAVGALLNWYAITYAAFTLSEAALPVTTPRRAWLLPLLTAGTTTSLDLLLDAWGLEAGLWEWTAGGRYAPEIVGPNGQRGIPLYNFAGWFLLTGLVAAGYLQLSPERPPISTKNHSPFPPVSAGLATGLLLSYYLGGVVWALRRGRRQALLHTVLVPMALLAAARRWAKLLSAQ